MKRVSLLFERFSEFKENFQNHQILISIIGFILFLLFGNNLYITYIEHMITDYKNAIKNAVLVKMKSNRNGFPYIKKSLRA